MPESPSQGQDQLQIDAPSGTIWSIIEDSARLPAWVPMVGSVDVPEGRREQVGAVRTCDVRMLGRGGQITERCTAMDPGRRVAYTVDHETLGFARLTTGFGFSIELRPVDASTTVVALTSSYRPRGLLGRLANPLLRHQLRRSRRTMLDHLKRLAERSPGTE